MLAVMLALAVTLLHLEAQALGLGRVVVLSALGEPLRAQIDVSGLTSEEAATLQAQLVSPEAFRAAGAEFNAALTGAHTEVQRQADGRALIVISGERKVVEPFLDVVLNVGWSSGKLQRAYTLLIDPPKGVAEPAVAAVTAAPAITTAPLPASRPTAPVARPKAEPRPVAKASEPRPVAVAAPPAARPATVAAAPAAEGDYKVRKGDTLSAIASRHRGASVSLDQMLVALYRANPDAFVGDNMNRLKAGVVLRVPDGQTAGGITRDEARQVIQAQSSDFRSYRRKLAGVAATTPAVQAKEPPRQVTGKVQTTVEDKKTSAAPPPPDQLKLSQGAVKGGEEAKIAAENQRKASEARMAELTRNVDALKQLAQSASAPPGTQVAAAALPPSAPGLDVPVASPPLATAVASEPLAAASAASGAVAKAASAAAAASAPKAAPLPPAHAEPGLLESLSENPLVLPAIATLVVGLAVIVLMRLRRRNDAGFGSETSFLESKLQPDSFFGASGGQRIDTHDSAHGGASSLSYSLSQLDAIGDVDPVAEADVYLAYGRDLQAEEILKEALRADPARVPVRAKLLEVYAKRADAINFELQAEQLRQHVAADSPEWQRAQTAGRELDPGNPLYGHEVADAVDFDTSTEPPPDLRPATDPWTPSQPMAEPEPEPALTMPMLPEPEPVTAPQPLPDLDMGPLDPTVEPEKTQPLDMPLPEVQELQAMPDLDIDLNAPPALTGMELTAPAGADELLDLGGADTQPLADADALSFDLQLDDEPTAAAPAAAEAPPLVFDFGDLSLELDGASPTSPAPLDDDALMRKLDLADEFQQIGDVEGARDLIDEVLGQAQGPQRERAQSMKDRLS